MRISELGSRLTQTAVQKMDEAVRVIEWRRYVRTLSSGRLPVLYAVGIFVAATLLAPALLAGGGLIAGSYPIDSYRGWFPGVLFVVCGLGAIVAAYLRVQALWQQERRVQGILAWLLTRQQPARVCVTTMLMAAALGILLVLPPLVFACICAVFGRVAWWQLPLALVQVVGCALVGAALGAANFFVGYQLVRPRWCLPGLVMLAGVVLAIWFGIEAQEGGWRRGWEEHPGRIGRALLYVTPVPTVFSALAPGWWSHLARPSLPLHLQAGQAGLVQVGWLFCVGGYCAWLSVRGYLRLVEDPDRLEARPRSQQVEGGQEFYWQGFRNPVLTRDIRTRLREKETAEFIGFASIAVAAGAFVPLVLTASDLADPLQTAAAAREVFFWLTMTLVALVTLIGPGLTSDVITQERERGSLELLISTPLRAGDILKGKLLGAVGVVLLLVSPSLPLFGLCYLFHGASGPQVFGVLSLVVLTAVACCFIGLMQSAINGRAGMAKFWAYATTALFVAFPGGPFWVAAALAASQAELRQSLGQGNAVAVVIGIVWTFVFALFWGNAREQLEYVEH